MSTSEDYVAIGHHRHLLLEYGGVIATETIEWNGWIVYFHFYYFRPCFIF